jgi:hypothetical protein
MSHEHYTRGPPGVNGNSNGGSGMSASLSPNVGTGGGMQRGLSHQSLEMVSSPAKKRSLSKTSISVSGHSGHICHEHVCIDWMLIIL